MSLSTGNKLRFDNAPMEGRLAELTFTILQADGLSMLNTAATANRAGGPVAQAPLMLSPAGDIKRGQRELVVDARVALVAAHDSLQDIYRIGYIDI